MKYSKSVECLLFRPVASALKRDVTSKTNMAADLCPEDYWDESSKRCARPLVTNLELLRPFDALNNWTLSDQRDINRTCALVEELYFHLVIIYL